MHFPHATIARPNTCMCMCMCGMPGPGGHGEVIVPEA